MSRIRRNFNNRFVMLGQESKALKEAAELLNIQKVNNAQEFEIAHARYKNKCELFAKDKIVLEEKQTVLKKKFSEQMLNFNTQLTYRELRKFWEITDGPLI